MNGILNIASKWWFWLAGSFLLYANTIGHDYVIDDQIVITRNTLTQQGFSGIDDIFSHSYLFGYDGREDESYRPLGLTTFAIERGIFDAAPNISHFIQILLYGLTVMVLYRLLVHLFGESAKGWVTVVTFLFMVHPIHTEVVANVKSRDELLCALFLFSSLLMYHKWLMNGKLAHVLCAVFFYFFATISKETAIPSVVLFPAIHWFVFKSDLKELAKSSWVILIPLIIYFTIRYAVLSNVLIQDPIDPVANSLALADNSFERFTSNLLIFTKYIQLAVFPVALSWDYSVSQFPIVGLNDFSAVSGLLLLGFLLFILVVGTYKRTLYGLGAWIFVSTFLVTSNFLFLINCPLGERFLFMPVLGLLLIIVPFLNENLSKSRINLAVGAVVVISGYFSIRTIIRNRDWKDNLTIYTAGAEVCPGSVKTHFNLGTEFITRANQSGSVEERKDYFQRSLVSLDKAFKIYPAYVNLYENSAFVFSELSKLEADTLQKIYWLNKGRSLLSKAIDSLNYKKEGLFVNQSFILTQLAAMEKDSLKRGFMYNDLLYLTKRKPNYNQEDFHHEIFALYSLGRYNELLDLVKRSSGRFPEKAELIAEMSRRFFAVQKYDESLDLLDVYLKLRPDDLSSLSNKGMLLEILGRKEEARQTYESVLKKDPNNKHSKQLYENLKNNSLK